MTAESSTRSVHRQESIGRKLYGQAALWQDWDAEAEDASVKYWELFLDLLLVAAASATADQLQENPSLHGLVEFTLLYLSFVNGLSLYSHHYTSRFVETSLFHSFVLFIFIMAMGITIVNAGFDTARYFSIGAIVQRVSVLVMVIPIAIQLQRARTFVVTFALVIVASVLGYCIAVVDPTLAMLSWTISGFVECMLEVILSIFVTGRKLVPVNVEHSTDRLGVLVLVMLGETVVSATMTYREREKEDSGEVQAEAFLYYQVLAYSFLIIFMFCLLYFHLQPPPALNAIRRSRQAGITMLLCTKALGLVLLAVGVSIKQIVRFVSEGESVIPYFTSALLGCSIGFAMLLMNAIRLCHYGGRYPGPDTAPDARRLMILWWSMTGVLNFVPFGLVHISNPGLAVGGHAGYLVFMCFVDTCFAHILEPHLPSEEKCEAQAESARLHQSAERLNYGSAN